MPKNVDYFSGLPPEKGAQGERGRLKEQFLWKAPLRRRDSGHGCMSPLLGDKVRHKIWEVISYLLYRTHLYLVILIWESASSISCSSDISVCRTGKAIVIIRHYLDRAMLLKLKCKYDSPENLMKMLIQSQQVWGGTQAYVFQISSRVMLMVLIQQPLGKTLVEILWWEETDKENPEWKRKNR